MSAQGSSLKRCANQGLYSYLLNREQIDAPRTAHRKAFRSIYPTDTLYNVRTPSCVLRKFSPDGKHFVCFSKNLHALQVFRYNGAPNNSHASSVFEDIFSLCFEVVLTGGHEMLSNDFLLFTRNGRHMIVASAVRSESELPSQRTPSSLQGLRDLDDVTFWIVDLVSGELVDKRKFEHDFIYLNHHAGVHLFHDTFGITSVKHQCIYMLYITEAGRFVNVRTLGWYNHDDDELLMAQYTNAGQGTRKRKALMQGTASDTHQDLAFSIIPNAGFNGMNRTTDPSVHVVPDTPRVYHMFRPLQPRLQERRRTVKHAEPAPLSGIQQRMMTFLYRKAVSTGKISAMHHFHRTFTRFSSLAMWRMQFLDADNIMIKFGEASAVAGTSVDLKAFSQTCFFVLYCLSTTEVYAVFENTSPELYAMVENDVRFWGSPNHFSLPYISTPPTSMSARECLRRQFRTIEKARNGGYTEAIKRTLSTLPHNNQSLIESPYLDQDLYSYDLRNVTNYDRPRPVGEFPTRFFDRETGKCKFSIDPNPIRPVAGALPTKRYVSYIFHPSEPLIISVLQAEYHTTVVNFFFRKS
ncbi:hypothetical protein PhCBS80983_g02300 [Powellomyces hirtus]|uniref:Uncharacterized protein n=1 Tax=Powellomyces hirtus TaxID=109895 RepID=A0A507E6J4_9FUNG|nr:hypothetical protein PhCBS80983_g02300 [Powellomyces hirtus]